jgi:hypothetical protein
VHTHGRKVCTTAAGKQRDIERGASIVTTINAAAAMHVSMRGTIAALGIIVAGGLVGCTSTGGGDLLTQSNPLSASNGLQAPKTASRAKIAIAPVIGAPDAVAKQVTAQLGLVASKSNIAIARTAGEKVDYTLRGYIVAARESRATKVSYIWDITSPTGARVHRITGEEVANGSGVGDPWASVTPQLIQTIASKTGTQLNAWLPQKAKPAPIQPTSAPIAGQAPRAAGTQVAKATPRGTTPIATSGIPPRPAASASASGINTPLTALVPQVVGAPGDGATSLATALRNELVRNGVRPTLPGVRSSYRVEGRVKVGPAVGGQQPIKIDWVVRDPKGVSLGTVSQENKIPAGSLNGKWGSTANAAATAATQGILKLLPRKVATR